MVYINYQEHMRDLEHALCTKEKFVCLVELVEDTPFNDIVSGRGGKRELTAGGVESLQSYCTKYKQLSPCKPDDPARNLGAG